jgi:hypothetical protein
MKYQEKRGKDHQKGPLRERENGEEAKRLKNRKKSSKLSLFSSIPLDVFSSIINNGNGNVELG